jgi:hypothetical protein
MPTGAAKPDTSEAAALRAQILELTEKYAALAHGPREFVPGKSTVPVSGKVYGAPELRNLVDSSGEVPGPAFRADRQFRFVRQSGGDERPHLAFAGQAAAVAR